MSDMQHPGDFLFALRDAERRKARPTTTGSGAPMGEDRISRYAQRALAAELAALASTTQGARNDQLNVAAFNLGQLVGAGALGEQDTRAALRDAALSAGLEPGETDRTIASGLPAGMANPRNLTVAADPPEPPTEPPPPPTGTQVEEFWQARPLLAHLHTTARARRTSPWAVLGVALARIVAATPAAVVLPPIVGGQASLNTFIGLVGKSGSGKGAAERVAAEALVYGTHIPTMQTGSGEGLVHAYRRRLRDGTQETVNEAVLFSVPEIDTLSALGSRQGATLMPVLRNAWSGEQLGFAYADPSRRLEVEPHTYRLCLVAGIQPQRAQALLDEADGGTPQRFLWLPATDRHAPDTPPECPEPMRWEQPHWNRHDLRTRSNGRTEMAVCHTARATIDAAHLARTRGEGDALDGHLLLAQLKAAAALAIADGRLEVNDEDWRLADVLTRWSTSVRAGIAEALKAKARASNEAKADAEAERAVKVADRTAEAQTQRVVRAVMRHLHDGEVVSRGDLRRRVPHRDRPAFDEAVGLLIGTGQVVEEGDGRGIHYHRA